MDVLMTMGRLLHQLTHLKMIKKILKQLTRPMAQASRKIIWMAYGGRESDKAITEQCGVLDGLEYGDVVLADMGFLISESVGMCHASLAIPAFTKEKRQLTRGDVEKTMEIANVRIHVERVIGMVRNEYTVLKGVLP
ncbi:hypothetical protein MTO96_038529 [Rhipicephalus appendiculatus]